MSTFYGHPTVDVLEMITMLGEMGYSGPREFVDANKNRAEYQATVSLLKARLERIGSLAQLEVKG